MNTPLLECSTCNGLLCAYCHGKSNNKDRCPSCRGEFIPSTTPNKLALEILGNLQFKCEMCQKIVLHKDRIEHWTNSCTKWECTFAGCVPRSVPWKVFPTSEELMKHWFIDNCPSARAACTLCKCEVPRDERKEHECFKNLLSNYNEHF